MPSNRGHLSGTVVAGRYEAYRLLGSGGMGDVYLAYRVEDQRPVALKVLHSQLGHLPNVLERFRREADLARRVPTAHTPEIYETGTSEDGTHFIAMELLEGESLDAHLNRVRPDPRRAVELLGRIAEALEAAHAVGIVHRDLKPQNVFVANRDGAPLEVRLLDFGVARMLDDASGMTSASTVLGTAGSSPPSRPTGARRSWVRTPTCSPSARSCTGR